MNIIKSKKILLKRISVLICCILMVALMNSPIFTVKASVPTRPEFRVSIDSYEPTDAKVGEDIIVHGTISPQPFEMPVQPKEIVLVLDTSGSMSSSSKLAKLKVAAKNFIDTMKDVPYLKIGIVDFSTDTYIWKDNGNNSLIDASKADELKGVIDSLQASGGTNTGDGLRQGAYLLSHNSEQNPDASKTLIFMSDGQPTFYYGYNVHEGRQNNHKVYTDSGYYTDITKSGLGQNVSLGGEGSGDYQGKCLDYAKTVGGIIKDQGYHVFSIGYGLDSSGNTKMKQIHDSMSEKSDNFFATDTGAIDSVFKTIATEIKDYYTITDVDFNFNPENGSPIESVDGNTIRLDDVTYKKDSESNGIILYKADPVPFTITIKSKIAGDNIPVFTQSTISFPWNTTETITARVPTIYIDINDNELPNIEAKLDRVEKTPCKLGDEVKVTYSINPKDFQYNDASTQLIPKDVVVILDTSSSMKTVVDGNGNGNGGGPLISTLWVDLLKNKILDNKNIKFGIVTADSSAEIKSYLTDGRSLHGVVGNIDSSSDSTSDMKLAMEKAEAVLNGSGSREGAGKYVVIISMGKLKNVDAGKEVLRNKGYNIISMSFESSDNSNLQSFHSKLIESGNRGAVQDNYIVAGDKHNNIKTGMEEIAYKLRDDTTYGTYNFGDVKLNFDLNNNFDAISGLEGTGNKRSIEIPDIVYSYNNGVWHADSISISFVIKPNKLGHLTFRANNDINNLANTISYTGINKKINRPINTPVIDVISPITVNHGLYSGINSESKMPAISDSSSKTFPKGSIVPMGAYIDGCVNGDKISLKIANGISITEDILVYKINDSGIVKPAIGKMELVNGEYVYNVSGVSENSGKILILYNVKIPDDVAGNRQYTNHLYVQGVDFPATIVVGGNSPDLF